MTCIRPRVEAMSSFGSRRSQAQRATACHSGVHKWGFSKRGVSNDNITITHKIAKPPFTKPPFVNSRVILRPILVLT